MPLTGKTLLIADDNPQNVELLEAFVAPLGCRVVTASDGERTLATAAIERPDLILLDIMMPKMSGYQVCERLRADAELRGIKILIVTALGAINDIERAMDVGADGVLTKPVVREELIEKIKELLGVSTA